MIITSYKYVSETLLEVVASDLYIMGIFRNFDNIREIEIIF